MTPRSRSTKQIGIAVLWIFIGYYIARGQTLPPAPKNYFNDYVGITNERTQHDLDERLAKFDKDTTHQIVIAIFPKLQSSLSIEEYTLRIANSWAVGQRGKSNGVILFIFTDDHKMRIEVGSGLTDVLTDTLAKKILDQDLTPHFKKGDFDGGLAASVDSILRIVGGRRTSDHAVAK